MSTARRRPVRRQHRLASQQLADAVANRDSVTNSATNQADESSNNTARNNIILVPPNKYVSYVTIPANVNPGELFEGWNGSRNVRVICPRNTRPGQRVVVFTDNPLDSNQRAHGSWDKPSYMVIIPEGVRGGKLFSVTIDSTKFYVRCPHEARPGMHVRIVAQPNSTMLNAGYQRLQNDSSSASPRIIFLDRYGKECSDSRSMESILCHGDISQLTRLNWKNAGSAIQQSDSLRRRQEYHLNNLKYVSVYGGKDSVSKDQFECLIGRSGSYVCPLLEQVDFHDNTLGKDGLCAVIPIIKSVKELQWLNLSNTGLGNDGVNVLSQALEYVRILELHLSRNEIGGDGLESLFSATNARFLRKLWLDNNKIGMAECQIISRFLRRDDIFLNYFYLSESTPKMDIERATALVEALAENSSLMHFGIGFVDGDEENKITPILMNLICNTSNFSSLCQSNHVLKGVGFSNMAPGQVSEEYLIALGINAASELSTPQKIRQKLQKFYFKGDFSIKPFLQFNQCLIPRVIEIACAESPRKNNSNGHEKRCAESCTSQLNNMYRFLRYWNVPSLFTLDSMRSNIRRLEAKIARLEFENQQLRRLQEENKMMRSKIENMKQFQIE